jgi:hypothetical protein
MSILFTEEDESCECNGKGWFWMLARASDLLRSDGTLCADKLGKKFEMRVKVLCGCSEFKEATVETVVYDEDDARNQRDGRVVPEDD